MYRGAMSARRICRWSALAVVAFGVLYVIVLALGVAAYGLTTPIGDPILAAMEVITILSAIAITVMVVAITVLASPSQRVVSTLALMFTTLFAGTTMLVHLIALTAGRQTDMRTLVWPSALYAAEIAAWDVFLGLALLCTAPLIAQSPAASRTKAAFVAAGVLCLVGVIGPVVGQMALQRIGIAGYALVLPIACAMVAHENRSDGSLRSQR
jgi:hypothetical protein